MNNAIRKALETDKLIDIITIGAKSGLPRTTEIWFTNIDGRIIICGTPNTDGISGSYTPRDWIANLKTNPAFTFCLKESMHAQLQATAVPVSNPADRRTIMTHPATQWYRDQVDSVEDLIANSPIVEVFFNK